MQPKTRYLPFVIALLLIAAPALAQHGGRVSIGADVGVLFPHMNHPDAQHFNAEADLVFGGHFDYGISDHAGLQFGMLRSDQEVETSAEQTNTMTIQELYTLFRWNLMPGRFQPYAALGLNYFIINLDPPLEDGNDPGFLAGLGFDAILTDNISLGISARFNYIFTDKFDSARLITCLATLAFTF